MNIKINDFGVISYRHRLEVVQTYCHQNEIITQERNSWNLLTDIYSIKETGKNPVKIQVGISRYHVLCKKTKTTYNFKIWLAV